MQNFFKESSSSALILCALWAPLETHDSNLPECTTDGATDIRTAQAHQIGVGDIPQGRGG